ncbi:MAG: PGF-CTERM sorting domain-containing protein [Halarchaeum sp.]
MRRQLASVLVVAVVLVGAVPAGAAAADTASTGANDTAMASVTFANQTSGGTTVTVDSVTLPDGGFVAIHDASVTDGNVLGSVVGTSAYLDAGTHENVTVRLDEPLSDLGAQTLVAMPHKDTNGDRAYAFVASNGETDGPYTSDGSAVVDAASVDVSATVSMSDQPTDGASVVVDRVELAQGGFVTVHDASVTDGDVFDSIRGTSDYLRAGVHHDVRVSLDDPVTENATLVPMAHRDTNDNEAYDFADSMGDSDGPYTADGSAVVDTAAVTVGQPAMVAYAGGATGGHVVTVDSAYLPEGGFVTVHDASVTQGKTFDSIRGTSAYLAPGLHRNVAVTLDDPVTNDTTLVPMAHKDTNDDETYDFADSMGDSDGPYTSDGSAVVDTGDVTVSASVAYAPTASDGHTVTVPRVDLSEGGYVTIHGPSLGAGDALGSVLGTTDYLAPGVHHDVTVALDSPVRSTRALTAMAHRETTGDETYDFVSSDGADDGPYVANGAPVLAGAQTDVNAYVAASDQSGDGTTVTVDSVTLADGGFVTIHDASVTDGKVFDSIRGTSAYLSPGTHENVEIGLDRPYESDGTLVPMAHRDTNGNETYDFADSMGDSDGPYVANGAPVLTTAAYTVEGASTTSSTMTSSSSSSTTSSSTSSGSSPGFGVALALVALAGAALLARRRD